MECSSAALPTLQGCCCCCMLYKVLPAALLTSQQLLPLLLRAVQHQHGSLNQHGGHPCPHS
jgi:hypothetical protein